MSDLPPGRILDAQVHSALGNYVIFPSEQIPHYSTDIAAAYPVFQKLAEFCGEVSISFAVDPSGVGSCYVQLRKPDFEQVPGETGPHAICLAALRYCRPRK